MLNIDGYRNIFEQLAEAEMSRCGLVFELYQRRLSQQIDGYLDKLNQMDKAILLKLAKKEFDYRSPEEILMDIEHDKKHGRCAHGLDLDCCPLGCGDL